MTEIVEPLPAFRELAEPEIMAALERPDPENPIAREVARLIQGIPAISTRTSPASVTSPRTSCMSVHPPLSKPWQCVSPRSPYRTH